jgi:hypothetical protein
LPASFPKLLVLALAGALLLSALAPGAPGLAAAVEPNATPSVFIYLPLIRRNVTVPTPTPTTRPVCPPTSGNGYSGGTAFQHDTDNPVRPAWNHADKNLALRGYTPNNEPNLRRELVDYGSGYPTDPPQLATLFSPVRVPPLVGFYRVYDWIWAPSPDPGTRGAPLTDWPVTALGLSTTPGELLRVPASGFDIGGGMEVIVLFADADTIALKYTREDSAGAPGYTLHIDRICTDPNLLALYNVLDNPSGPRYVYPNPSYPLPNMPAGHPIGVARGTEVVLAIVDSGAFMDTRSCNEWWRVRPGYGGTCPPGPSRTPARP